MLVVSLRNVNFGFLVSLRVVGEVIQKCKLYFKVFGSPVQKANKSFSHIQIGPR